MKTRISWVVEVLDKKTNEWEGIRWCEDLSKAEEVLKKLVADRMKSVVPYDPWTKARVVESVTEYKVYKEITPEF